MPRKSSMDWMVSSANMGTQTHEWAHTQVSLECDLCTTWHPHNHESWKHFHTVEKICISLPVRLKRLLCEYFSCWSLWNLWPPTLLCYVDKNHSLLMIVFLSLWPVFFFLFSERSLKDFYTSCNFDLKPQLSAQQNFYAEKNTGSFCYLIQQESTFKGSRWPFQ